MRQISDTERALATAPAAPQGQQGFTPSGKPRRRPLSPGVFIGLAVAIAAVSGLILFGGIDKLTVGLLSIVLLLLIMMTGIPVGVAMIMAAMVALVVIVPGKAAASSLQSIMFDATASWSLSVIPLFILMGFAMWRGGIATKAYHAANQWLGRAPGGLGVATNLAGAGLAASSGSTLAITLALGRMSIPEMLRTGYSPKVATGTVAMAGTLGQIIPPSILLVIYAGMAEVAVGPLLLAAVVPGLILAVGFSLTVVVWALVRPKDVPRADQTGVTWGTRLRSLTGLVPILLIMLVIIGGMFTGIFTATEAAAFAALVSIVTAIVTAGKGNRGVKASARFLGSIIMSTVVSVASVMIILVGALLLTRAIALSGVAQVFSRWLVDLQLGRVELLLLLIVFYIVLGMFLESLPMILLTVPLLAAPLEAVGVDMIWFGIFLVIVCEIGLVFPPIGLLTFVVHRLAQDPDVNAGKEVKLTDVFLGIMPFVGVAILVLMLFIFIPEIVLWLPGISSAS